MLQGKHILIGVTGSIAAYKTALLARLLIKEGAEVRVVMTESATSFITPLTLSTLTKHPVLTSFTQPDGSWNNHVDLGLWADLMVVAPASARTISRFANGYCDNLLTAVYLSARCPVMIAPAMDLDMYLHPSTARNLDLLKGYGNLMVDPEHGELASGLIGTGRMAEPETLVEHIREHFEKKKTNDFSGKKVLITAGPTHEPIDPVRFIGNHSSGKMGFALAEHFADRGADVELVSGPTSLNTHHPHIRLTRVNSAGDMFEACKVHFTSANVLVFAAAVADYTPNTVADKKLKKTQNDLFIELSKTRDIAAEFGKVKRDDQVSIGFALETDSELEHALKKLEKKNFDLIVLNSLRDTGAGFGHDTNKVTIIDRSGEKTEYELKNKKLVAEDIVNSLAQKIHVA